jgi:hypothetical protein
MLQKSANGCGGTAKSESTSKTPAPATSAGDEFIGPKVSFLNAAYSPKLANHQMIV